MLTLVERNRTGACTHIAIVCISHLTRTVYDASHNTNLETFQFLGSLLDLSKSGLEVEKSATAGRTGYIFRLGKTCTRSLQNVECQFYALLKREVHMIDDDAIDQLVNQHNAKVGSSA